VLVKNSSQPLNTLGLDHAGLNKFLDNREAKGGGNKDGTFRRTHVRWAYRAATVTVVFIHPGGTETKLTLACRNLSAGGIGLLHRAFVHPGTKCVVFLPNVRKQLVEIPGKIVRCIHLEGAVHDLGVEFEKPVRARDFVQLDPFADGFALEKVDPAELKGNVLYVEDSVLDQSLVRHFLRDTQISLHIVDNKEAALEKAMDHIDLILCDYDLGHCDGAEVVAFLREKGLSTPIIILTANTDKETRERLIKAQSNAFLSKPLERTMLFRAIAEFMVLSGAGSGMTTSLPKGHPNLGLLPTFVQQVREYAKALDQAMKGEVLPKCRTLAVEISGAATVMGFEKLASLAQTAEKAASSGKPFAEAQAPLRMVMTACLQVSPRAPE
jgi:CheY-like chemotaxis protein